MTDWDRINRAAESISAAIEIARMIHAHHAGQADADHPGELSQASAVSLSLALKRLLDSAWNDLDHARPDPDVPY